MKNCNDTVNSVIKKCSADIQEAGDVWPTNPSYVKTITIKTENPTCTMYINVSYFPTRNSGREAAKICGKVLKDAGKGSEKYRRWYF